MIELVDNLLVGNSDDVVDIRRRISRGTYVDGVQAVLNVAQDLPGVLDCRWQGIEYAQIGLVDGPGNTIALYCAAILALHDLCRRGKTLIYDHDGGRALAVAMMYLCLKAGRRPAGGDRLSSNMHCWIPWDDIVRDNVMLAEEEKPTIHTVHKEAYDKMPFEMMGAML